MQIDGGVICNNPSLYAYELAKDFHGHKKIRLISLGTGEKPFAAKDPNSMTKVAYMSMMGEFMMNIDTYTADNILKHRMPEDKYLRMQIVSDIGMDKVDPKSIAGLKKNGMDLWDLNKEKMTKMLNTIIDERFAPKPSAPKTPASKTPAPETPASKTPAPAQK